MPQEKQLSEQESLQLITDMIQKLKCSYHDKGIGSILWGSVVAIASIVSFLQIQYHFQLGFDIWLIVLGAIIPQIILINKDRKTQKVIRHEDAALNAVWLVYAFTIFGLSVFEMIVPNATNRFIEANGWQMMRHQIDNSKPDELLIPFTPSIYSIYILIYAFPTMVTGIVKKFKPMIIGGSMAYCFFVLSCFTETKYDYLLGGTTAILCWLIPGIILRRKYLQQKRANV